MTPGGGAASRAIRSGHPSQPSGQSPDIRNEPGKGQTPAQASSQFRSILGPDGDGPGSVITQPSYFSDLHLDQIVTAVLAGHEEYDLKEFFWQPLHDLETIQYRHEIVRDLQQEEVLTTVGTFATGMRQVRQRLALADASHYARQRERWLLEAIAVYCETVRRFTVELTDLTLRSTGLRGLQIYLTHHIASDAFTALDAETGTLLAELAQVRYAVDIRGAHVRVSRCEDQSDLTAEVQATFARFREGEVKDYLTRFRSHADMNHVEAQILDLVARLYPETFARLRSFGVRHRDALDPTIVRFDREVQFYVAYLEHTVQLGPGLQFCLPDVSVGSKQVEVSDGFDLSLAAKLGAQGTTVVCSDFTLTGAERILVVTGPNQGGKTTFARMVGQVHHLGGLGLPIPARQARLQLPDRVFTHFEREESLQTLRGKFEDELVRIHEILDHATSDSILIMNESFGSTSLRDALLVGSEIVRQIISRDALCVFVTFVDELASLSEATVSLMSSVDPDDPVRRTYRIERKPADGLAYAAALADKYGLSYESLRRRIAR